jgi:hemerythrin superfamily protein
MDIVDLIKDDHEQIMELIERVEASSDDDVETREELFDELRNFLEAHTNAEETALYERLSDEEETRERVLESYEEHQLVSEILLSLQELEVNDDDWMNKFSVLRENVEQHADMEESILLPKAMKLIPGDEREQLADTMSSLEDEIITDQAVRGGIRRGGEGYETTL